MGIAIGKDLGIAPKEERKNMWMDAVSFLISKGSNLDTQDKQGWTALMYACNVTGWHIFNGAGSLSVHIVSELLDAGARTDIRSHKGEVALTIANSHNVFKDRNSGAARRIILKEKKTIGLVTTTAHTA